jgi:AraC-like DNA-binding protein
VGLARSDGEERGGTLSSLVLRALFLGLARAGVEGAPLLAELGLSEDLLQQNETRVEAHLVFRAFERAIDLVGDEAFCLRVADEIPVGSMAVLDFSLRSSSSMGEALERVIRYYALIDDGSSLDLEIDGQEARLAGRRIEPVSPRPATELLFALILGRGRDSTGQACPLKEVSFAQGPPRDRRGHEKFFGVPVRFDQPRNELVFDAAWLELPCRAGDPALASFLDQQVSGLLERLPRATDFLDGVRHAVTEAMRGTAPSLDTIAKRLGIGSRTLQRHLNEHGTTFQEILARVREEHARKFLADERMSVGEVAYLLGFSDPSAFHHAFTRWTGATPSAYRKSARESR